MLAVLTFVAALAVCAEAGVPVVAASKYSGSATPRFVALSGAGYAVSISLTAALDVAGAAAETTLSGVPSTGQKLNRSANSSWHVLQNFIATTSLFRWE